MHRAVAPTPFLTGRFATAQTCASGCLWPNALPSPLRDPLGSIEAQLENRARDAQMGTCGAGLPRGLVALRHPKPDRLGAG